MIRLKAPLNYRGVLVEKDSVIGYLPTDLQEKLIKSGVAEIVDEEAAVEEATKDKLEIPSYSEDMSSKELKELMGKYGLAYKVGMSKSEMVAALKEYFGTGSGESPETSEDNGDTPSDS